MLAPFCSYKQQTYVSSIPAKAVNIQLQRPHLIAHDLRSRLSFQ